MSKRTVVGALVVVGMPVCAGCPQSTGPMLRIKLINTSETQFVSPNLGVCPNGMLEEPHHFLTPNPVLAPGDEVTYTTSQIAGTDGDCTTFATAFMVGLCTWKRGPSADNLTLVDERFGGQIGVQFYCGDTVIFRWSDTGEPGGTWTAEVQTALGNPLPSGSFQELES